MARTVASQAAQVAATKAFSDGVTGAHTVGVATGQVDLEGDLNVLRSLMKDLVGGPAGDIDVNTKLMLHMNGPDASTTFTDEMGKAITANGSAQIDDSAFKFGGACGLFNGSGYLSTPDSPDFAFGSGEFTIDFWVNFAGLQNGIFVQQYRTGNIAFQFYYYSNSLRFIWSDNGSSQLGNNEISWTPTTGTWYHVAAVKSGTTIKFYVNGNQIGTTTVNAAIYDSTAPLEIGSEGGTGNFLNARLDELRISTVARWASNFAVPTAEYAAGAKWYEAAARTVEQINTDVDQVESDVAALEPEVDSLQTRMDTAETDIDNLQADVAELQASQSQWKKVSFSQLTPMGGGVYQTPDAFFPESLVVYLRGVLLVPENEDGYTITATNAFTLKEPLTDSLDWIMCGYEMSVA